MGASRAGGAGGAAAELDDHDHQRPERDQQRAAAETAIGDELEARPRAPPTTAAPPAGPARRGRPSGPDPGGPQARANTAAPSSACGSRAARGARWSPTPSSGSSRAARRCQAEARSQPQRRSPHQKPAPAERPQHRPFDRGPRDPPGPGRARRDDRAPSSGARAGIAAHARPEATRIAGAVSTPRTRARPGRPRGRDTRPTARPQAVKRHELGGPQGAQRGRRLLFVVRGRHGDRASSKAPSAPSRSLVEARPATDASPAPGQAGVDRRQRGAREGQGGSREARATGFRSPARSRAGVARATGFVARPHSYSVRASE